MEKEFSLPVVSKFKRGDDIMLAVQYKGTNFIDICSCVPQNKDFICEEHNGEFISISGNTYRLILKKGQVLVVDAYDGISIWSTSSFETMFVPEK